MIERYGRLGTGREEPVTRLHTVTVLHRTTTQRSNEHDQSSTQPFATHAPPLSADAASSHVLLVERQREAGTFLAPAPCAHATLLLHLSSLLTRPLHPRTPRLTFQAPLHFWLQEAWPPSWAANLLVHPCLRLGALVVTRPSWTLGAQPKRASAAKRWIPLWRVWRRSSPRPGASKSVS